MDNDGLICAWLLDGRGGGRQLDWEALASVAPAHGEVLWTHFDYSVPRVQNWLATQSGLSEVTVAALIQTETRPRVVVADAGLMLFLRAVNLNPGAEPDDMVSARLWLGEQRVISLRQRRLMSVDDLRAAIEAGTGPRNSGEFLVMLVDGVLERIDHVVEVVDENIDALEVTPASVPFPEQRGQLAEIRRQAIALRRFLAPQREALNRLAADTSAILGEQERLRLREEYDRQTRVVEELDAVRERAALAQESPAAVLPDRPARRQRRRYPRRERPGRVRPGGDRPGRHRCRPLAVFPQPGLGMTGSDIPVRMQCTETR